MAGPPSPRGLAERVGDFVAGATQGVADFVAPGDGEAEKQQQAKKREQALDKSMLPPQLLKRLSPVVDGMGFQLDPQPRKIVSGNKEPVQHHRIEVEGGYIALLYYGEGLLGDGAYYYQILDRLYPFPAVGAKGWVVFCDVTDIADNYKAMTNFAAGKDLMTAYLVDSQEASLWDSESAQGKKRLVTNWMRLDKFKPTARPGSALTLSHLNKNTPEAQADQKAIMDTLAARASKAPPAIGSKGYMAQLIHNTNWPVKPHDHKATRVGALTGVPDFDAGELVRWALGMRRNPDHKNYTFIGGLLEVLIGDLGAEGQDLLEGIIAKYNLITS